MNYSRCASAVAERRAPSDPSGRSENQDRASRLSSDTALTAHPSRCGPNDVMLERLGGFGDPLSPSPLCTRLRLAAPELETPIARPVARSHRASVPLCHECHECHLGALDCTTCILGLPTPAQSGPCACSCPDPVLLAFPVTGLLLCTSIYVPPAMPSPAPLPNPVPTHLHPHSHSTHSTHSACANITPRFLSSLLPALSRSGRFCYPLHLFPLWYITSPRPCSSTSEQSASPPTLIL